MSIKRRLILLTFCFAASNSASAATEVTSSKTITLAPSHSRVLITKETIEQAFISDPEIAEPVVCSKNLIVLLGKKPGATTFSIKNAHEEMAVYTLNVTEKDLLYPDDPDALDLVKTVSIAHPKLVDMAFSLLNVEGVRADSSTFKIKLYSDLTKPNLAPELSKWESSKRASSVEQLDIPVSQARMFSSSVNIKEVISTDNSVLQPVRITKTDYALIGRKPGLVSVKTIGQTGKLESVQAEVTNPTLTTTSSNWLPLVADEFLWEKNISKNLALKCENPKRLEFKNRIVRTSIGNPGIAVPIVIDEHNVILIGLKPGGVNLFIWDDAGGMEGIHIVVEGHNSRYKVLEAAVGVTSASHIAANFEKLSKTPTVRQEANHESDVISPNFTEIVIWSGDKKDVLAVPNN